MASFTEKIYDVLNLCQQQGQAVAFSYWEDDKESFIVGRVDQLTREKVSLSLISPDGLQDDRWEGALKEIVRFHYDSDYLRGLQQFAAHREEALANPVIAPRYSVRKGHLYRKFLVEMVEQTRVVTIEDDDHDRIIGFVHEVGEDFVAIQALIEDTGAKDGICVILLDDIHHFSCGSVREMELEYLHRVRYALE